MNLLIRQRGGQIGGLVLAALLASGCKGYLVFSTATKFGIDISQQGDQTPNISMGYKRAEAASIPVPMGHASGQEDVYSVLGYFCVKYNPTLNLLSDEDAVEIRSVFATGLAARKALEHQGLREHFAMKAAEAAAATKEKGAREPKKCL